LIIVYAFANYHTIRGFGGGKKTLASAAGQNRDVFWYDEMNPQHHYDRPGKAPDGMDLLRHDGEQTSSPTDKVATGSGTDSAAQPGTLAKRDESTDSTKMAAGSVSIPMAKQVLAGVRTAVVERKPLIRDIHTTAQIVADETRIAHVHVKVSGYIDKVYVDFVGQLVKKGQPLFTLYSPDLVSTEEEYLIAKRGESVLGNAPFQEIAEGSRSLLQSTRMRLTLWDISDAQIEELDRSGKVSKDLTFYSPITGFVTDRKVFPQTSVTPETELYTVSDLSTVWAEAQIFENEVPYVHLGQKIVLTLSYVPGRTYTGKVSYIDPTVDAQTRSVRVRVQIANPRYALKPQMFADAQLRVDYGTKVVVPQEAVLDSGTEQIVFVVHEGGIFEPRKVTLGPVIDGNVAVLTGLRGGETVVTSGNFLVDSESRLKSSMGGMQH
jgi:Cu(I)/Ag(I) efflux system membrane fusion protein